MTFAPAVNPDSARVVAEALALERQFGEVVKLGTGQEFNEPVLYGFNELKARDQEQGTDGLSRLEFFVIRGHSTTSFTEAVDEWLDKMSAFCAGKTGRLIWRRGPVCKSDYDFEYAVTHYTVTARLACE